MFWVSPLENITNVLYLQVNFELSCQVNLQGAINIAVEDG